ncbi:MAG: trypsin-like serine protease [Chthoniobacter sp.]|nr:trypsin-like serine protease [Chthoniobacter sp.]
MHSIPRHSPSRRWKTSGLLSRWLLLGGILALGFLDRTLAIENGTNGSFNTTAPTGSDIPNWNTGWTQPQGQSGITGWNYVGIVAGGGGGASGVYLGNNWVLTAGHVGPGDFTLGINTYSVVPGSAQSITDSNGTADMTLFQIATAPNLPVLSIAASAPKALSTSQAGSKVAMIGYGTSGGLAESWGLNTVTEKNVLVSVGSFVSTDFVTGYGTTTMGSHSATNNYFLFLGDSGGGDFIFNSTSAQWELAGINEAVDGSNNSAMVQLSTYAPQINAIVTTPEPTSCVFLGGGLLALLGNARLGRVRHAGRGDRK